MQYIALITLFFAAAAIAVPISFAQINAVGTNNYGDDGVPSKTDGSGSVVRLDGAKTATGKV